MSLRLDQVVPWGRSRREYELMFALEGADLADGVLDCGGGPSSFTAELAADGIRAVSADPIYAFGGHEIQARFEATVGPMMAHVRATPGAWVWGYHRDPDDLCAHRRSALERFLGNYEAGKHAGRYLTGQLPRLPFATGSFGLAVCSHLLFLYSDLLSADFHVQSARELCRVALEARIFPLVTLQGAPTPHLDAVRLALRADGWKAEVVQVKYELQRGGNQMLRISRPR